MRREFPASLNTVRTAALQPLAGDADLGDEAGVSCQPSIQYVLRCSRSLAALISAMRREFPASLYTVRTALAAARWRR